MLKLNVGCGTDLRKGFVNIDGSTALNVDKVIDLNSDRLTNHFEPQTVDFILANDIIEHMYHWEATETLKDFHALLKSGGSFEIRVPDCEWIMSIFCRYSAERKLTLIFGGQDIPG